MASKLSFDFDSLSPRLKVLLPKIDAGVSIAFKATEARAESFARQNAPWTDRTGNARNGLFAKHDSVPMVEHRLTVYHTMPYGYWLELRWSGRYAIIGPTIINTAPELAQMVTAVVSREIRSMGG
jgi:hypothetical protein